MSQASELLDEGAVQLLEEWPINFTVDGYGARAFVGLCDRVRKSNQLVSGGFALEADAVLGVAPAQFKAVGLEPFVGMRLRVYGVDLIVERVGKNNHLWELTLEAAQTNAI